DVRASAVLQEELAWGDVGAAVALAGPGAAGAAGAALGDAEQKERLLKPFAAEDAFARRGAPAIVEGPFGPAPDRIATVAERTCGSTGCAFRRAIACRAGATAGATFSRSSRASACSTPHGSSGARARPRSTPSSTRPSGRRSARRSTSTRRSRS